MKGILIHGVPEEGFYKLLDVAVKRVYVTEGRPELGGAKEVAPKIKDFSFDPVLISDNMVSYLLWRGMIERVYLFYQRIHEKEAECKIGSLTIGISAEEHGIPVYLYKSKYVYDLYGPEGDVFYFNQKRVAPLGVRGYNPLIDLVPLKFITKLYKDGKWIGLKRNY